MIVIASAVMMLALESQEKEAEDGPKSLYAYFWFAILPMLWGNLGNYTGTARVGQLGA